MTACSSTGAVQCGVGWNPGAVCGTEPGCLASGANVAARLSRCLGRIGSGIPGSTVAAIVEAGRPESGRQITTANDESAPGRDHASPVYLAEQSARSPTGHLTRDRRGDPARRRDRSVDPGGPVAGSSGLSAGPARARPPHYGTWRPFCPLGPWLKYGWSTIPVVMRDIVALRKTTAASSFPTGCRLSRPPLTRSFIPSPRGARTMSSSTCCRPTGIAAPR